MDHQRKPQIPGSDDREHLRSGAASRVAALASASDLFFFNYEYRQALPLPEWMAPPEPLPRFEGGVLPELKYQAFRHDLLIGSFHPAHRAKWTAHELCHILVGFAHRPGAPPGFHAIGAWLAELLPVALYYFFDEIDLRRCPRHQGEGPLYRQYCAACERAALEGPLESGDERFEREGRSFIERELGAIERARKSGEIVGTRFGSIDLASDAIAYAAAHRARLEAESFERFASEFFSKSAGLHKDLDGLAARLLEVMEGILTGAKVKPLGGDRFERMAQDLGYRMLLILEETEGEAWDELDRIIARLGDGVIGKGSRIRDREEAIVRAQEEYAGLAEAFELPDPSDVFSVGYALPNETGEESADHGFAIEQILEGLDSVVSNSLMALGEEGPDVVEAFILRAPPERAPLGRRFARFLESEGHELAAAHARFESAVVHSSPASPEDKLRRRLLGRGDRYLLASSVELVRSPYAIEDDAEPADIPLGERAYLMRREDDGDVSILSIDPALADALEAHGALSFEELPEDLFAEGYLLAEVQGPID